MSSLWEMGEWPYHHGHAVPEKKVAFGVDEKILIACATVQVDHKWL